ncbi:MAG TPA: YIP1 family protein [Pyrinomonadaceae bacterium]|nr:YIP1 family protein [Pyrinomonadaceae bacterium]
MSETNFTSPPATPAQAGADAPVMSTPAMLTGIFLEPGRTFEALRERPRFLVAAVILVVLSVAVALVIFNKIDYAAFMRDQITKGPNGDKMTPEQVDRAVGFYTGPIGKVLIYVFPVVGTAVVIAAGAGLYLLGSMLMGGRLRFKQALSVWTYSSFAPSVLATVVTVIVVLITPADEIDPAQQGGLVRANLSIIPHGDSKALGALLGSFDLFALYGLYLAALGMRKMGKLSSGSAWTIALGLWLVGVLLKVGWAAAFGK